MDAAGGDGGEVGWGACEFADLLSIPTLPMFSVVHAHRVETVVSDEGAYLSISNSQNPPHPMRFGVKLRQNQAGNVETDSFVANISNNGSEIEAEFVYTSENVDAQESGWIVLSPAEAQQLGAALIAVAGGYTQGKKASFTAESGSIKSSSVGE